MERPDFEDQATGNRFADGLLMPIFAVAAVFLFVILCFYAYNHVMKNKNSGEVVILQGDDAGFKVAPKDPGGMEVAHTEKAVFNTVTGEAENINEGSVKLEQGEEPVSHEQLAAGAVGNDDHSTPQTSSVVLNQSGQEDVPPAIVAGGDADVGLAPETDVQADIHDNAGAVELFESAEMPATTTSVTPAATASAPAKPAAQPQKLVKAEVKKEADKTVVKFKEVPKSLGGGANAAASSSGSGSFYVQVSSHSSRAEAESAWGKISSRYSSEVSGKSKNITEANVSGKTFYRLSFGPFSDRSAASTKCGILKAKGQDCIIQKY